MADVLQEFLVGVGFKVEKAGLEAFQKALKGGATQAVAFGTIWAKVAEEAVDAAGAVVKATFAMAQQLDTLYFAGIRVQDTADHVAAAGYAFSQMGSNAQAARQALAGIADFVRTTPGALSYMQSIGIVTTDEHGNPLSTEKLMENTQRMIHQMNQTQPALADQYRQMFGMSVDQMLMDPDKFDEAMDEYAQIRDAMHLTGDAAVETGHRFEHTWTRMKEVTGIFTEAFVTEYMPELTESMNTFSDLLMGKWSEAWEHWGRAMRDAAERAARDQERKAYEGAKRLESLGLVSHEQVIALRDSIRARRRGTLARDRVEDAQTAAENAELGDDSLDEGGPTPTPRSDAQKAAKRQADYAAQAAAAAKEAASRGDKAEEARYAGIAHQAALAAASEARTAAGLPPDGGDLGGNPTFHTPGAPAKQKKIWDAADFFASYAIQRGMPEFLARAAAAGIVGEGGWAGARNPISGALGLGQWLGKRQQLGLAQHPSWTLPEQSAYLFDELYGRVPGEDPADIKAGRKFLSQRSTEDARRSYIYDVMRPVSAADPFGGERDMRNSQPYLMSASAAGGGVILNQRTEITINGVSDALAAGQHVLQGQEGVNGRLARNAGQNHAY